MLKNNKTLEFKFEIGIERNNLVEITRELRIPKKLKRRKKGKE